MPERTRAFELYDAGFSIAKISKMIDRHPATIRDALAGSGRQIRQASSYTRDSFYLPEDRVKEYIRLYRDENLTCKEIGSVYNRHEVSIRNAIRRAGSLRSRSEAQRIAKSKSDT